MTSFALTCPLCGLSKSIPTAKVPARSVNVTCPQCKHVFSFHKELAEPNLIQDDVKVVPPSAISQQKSGRAALSESVSATEPSINSGQIPTIDKQKNEVPATRMAGVTFLGLTAAIFAGNWVLLLLLNRYFPILLALTGPLITLGTATIIYPPIFDSVFSKTLSKDRPVLRWVAIAATLMGVVLSLFIFLKLNYG